MKPVAGMALTSVTAECVLTAVFTASIVHRTLIDVCTVCATVEFVSWVTVTDKAALSILADVITCTIPRTFINIFASLLIM
jgi:hypothetical protein